MYVLESSRYKTLDIRVIFSGVLIGKPLDEGEFQCLLMKYRKIVAVTVD